MATVRSKLAPKVPPKGAAPNRVVSAQKTQERVWNITDHPKTPGNGKTLMLLGKIVGPGRAVLASAEMIKSSKRVKELLKTGDIFVGARPPQDYLLVKNKVRAQVTGAHAHPDTTAENRKLRKEAVKARAYADELAKTVSKLTNVAEVSPMLKRQAERAEQSAKDLEKQLEALSPPPLEQKTPAKGKLPEFDVMQQEPVS